MITGMKIEANDIEIPVYPSPWSVEREIDGVDYKAIQESNQNLGNRGLLGYRDAGSTATAFGIASVIELGAGAATVALEPVGFAVQVGKLAGTIATLETQSIVQYEISPSRHLETPSGDEVPDLMGPGKGDLYYGEGWTLALQTKYRLGIKKEGDIWVPDTAEILTYDIMDRNNQYVYTIRDIVNVIADLNSQISAIGDPGDDKDKQKEKKRLEDGKRTWEGLLQNNPAYTWLRDYIKGSEGASREDLEKFLKDQFGEPKGKSELLVFTGGGTTFEYSRTIGESGMSEYSTSIDVSSSAEANFTLAFGPSDDVRIAPFAGPNINGNFGYFYEAR